MTGWVRSSACAAGDCIEAGISALSRSHPEVIMLRRWAGGMPAGSFGMTRAEWDAFIAGIKAGDFDQLTGDTP